MRFLHTADWHIGKKLHGYDLQAEQRDALVQIKEIALKQQVDAIVVAGDVYDRSLPSEEAVAQVNQILEELNLTLKFPLLVISGNHDSAVRLKTGSQWFDATKFYLKTQLADAFKPIVLQDTQFFMLPYFELQAARNYFAKPQLATLNEAVDLIVQEMRQAFLPDKKHVLIAHFFVAGSTKSASETLLEVGGLSPVSTTSLAAFDYVALGHLHDKKALQHPKIKYSGTPYKYSLAEANSQKGVYIVDTTTGTVTFEAITPLRDVKVLRGSYAELLSQTFSQQVDKQAYLGIELTDTKIIPNVLENLRQVYPRILNLKRINGSVALDLQPVEKLKTQTPMELLATFFEEINQQPLSQNQQKWAQAALIQIQKEDAL